MRNGFKTNGFKINSDCPGNNNMAITTSVKSMTAKLLALIKGMSKHIDKPRLK